MINKKIGFIGAGKMGGAIIKGLLQSGFVSKEDITASELTEDFARATSEELNIKVITENSELVKESDIIFLATKPFVLKEVLESLKNDFSREKLVVSIAAGITTKTIESVIGNIPVIRVMPNTPAIVNEGMSAVCKGEYATKEHADLINTIFSKIGKSCLVEEKLIDAVTGISGSGPAFCYKIIDSMAKSGAELGLPYETALTLAAQTMLGASKMIMESQKTPDILIKEVTTPGGCTEKGLEVLDSFQIQEIMIKTVTETAKKAFELGKS